MKNITYCQANDADILELGQLLSLLFNIEKDFNPDTSKQQTGLELLVSELKSFSMLNNNDSSCTNSNISASLA